MTILKRRVLSRAIEIDEVKDLAKSSLRIAKGIKRDIEEKVVKKYTSNLIMVPTGSTLLNLGLSDDPYGGFVLGKMGNIIGDSSAGKTMLLWSIFAEAIRSKAFKDYDCIYDDAENALEIDTEKLFSKKVCDRVDTESIQSDTIEDFNDNVLSALKNKKKVIYGLDSFDALTSEAELKRDIREGSYRMEKPKMSSEILRKIKGTVKESDSLVLIISQTRDNIGVTFGSKKTRSGGKALKFYCTYEMWLAIKNHIKRLGRDVGVNVIVKISKNKITGKQRQIEFPIYFDYGIDDYLSCINYLIEEKVWSKSKSLINTKGFFKNDYNEDTLIDKIIDSDKYDDLKLLVAKRWDYIENKIATPRRPKYGD